jgi:hypothetical protein
MRGDGLAPVLVALYAAMNEQHVAFYNNGVFMREIANSMQCGLSNFQRHSRFSTAKWRVFGRNYSNGF